MVWYLAVTEWIMLSAPLLHVAIQEDIRRGDIVYQLGRPISYVGAVLARGVGQLAVRLAWLGVAAVIWAFVFSGSLPDASVVLVLAPLGLLAANLLCVIYVLVGLTAFWIHEVNSIYWVVQKFTFILGGLMLPLSFYPAWLRDVARATPFANILEGPAALLLESPPWSAVELSLRLVAWSALLIAVAILVLRRAVAMLEPGGG
jgi:ABC-2 type transport system permease protein